MRKEHKRSSTRARCALLLLAMLSGQAQADPLCAAPSGSLTPLRDAMERGRFIAYQPTALKVIDGKPTKASRASIEADLRILRSRFDGLITYGSHSGGESIADVAAKLDYRAVIVGIWEISNPAEIENAVAAWRRNPSLVVGLSLGNESVLGKRSDFVSLAKLLADLRARAPQLPLATTEPFHLWLEPSSRPALREMDFLLANAHPIFESWFKTAKDSQTAEFVLNVGRELRKQFCGPVLIKETGIPTAPLSLGFSEARQMSFYRRLRETFAPSPDFAFAYFSAFDAPWRAWDAHPIPGDHPEEAHFGLYYSDRKPKPVVGVIPPLESKTTPR